MACFAGRNASRTGVVGRNSESSIRTNEVANSRVQIESNVTSANASGKLKEVGRQAAGTIDC